MRKLSLAVLFLLSTVQLALAAPGVSLSASIQGTGGNSLTLSLACGLKGHYPTRFGNAEGQVQGGYPEKVNIASAYFYVKGTGIGRASDDLYREALPDGHAGRAYGAKTWADLLGIQMQPRYEIDIALKVTNQPDPPVYFITGVTYHGGSDYRGIPTQTLTPTVQRRHDTNYINQRVNLIRYCDDPESTETISVTVTGTITGKRPR